VAAIDNIDTDHLGLRPGDRVLDLGCARGEHSLALARAGFRVVGADVDEALLAMLRSAADREQLPVETWVQDVQAGLPEPGSFDAVVCTEVLEHVPDYRRGIAEIARALKPGGRACISVPTGLTEMIFHRLHPYYVHDSTHVNVFTRSLLLSELERAGLRVLRFEGKGSEWTAFWLLHGPAHSRFDHTGTPVENDHLTRRYWRARRWLMRFRLDQPLWRLGNRVLPKSVYVYAERPTA
jgi:cyclopropane fatty-acyl-phospholipid synthase-like methyltransferase